MEARNRGGELVPCRLLGGQAGHRLSGTHPRKAWSPQGVATVSGARQSVPPTPIDRWSICDNCDCYCTGRAGDWLPGSFVYCTDNSLAGPPKLRKGCFPKLHGRETLWRNGTWSAKFLRRACLVQQWQKKPREIERWLALHNDGAWKAASIQRRLQASSGGGGWQSGWGRYRRDNWWGSRKQPERLEVTQRYRV